MASRKQLAANRQNAQKSTGPKTVAGKNRSRLNAQRHGLTGQVTVMTEEDRIASDAFITAIVTSFNTKTAYERQLAHAIATCHWRINRAAALEENILTLGLAEQKLLNNLVFENSQVDTAFTQAAAYRNDPNAFERLSLYTTRLTNQAAKHLKELKALQAERQTQETIAMEEAAILYKFHKMANLPFDPAENGFVLSTPQIRQHVHRETVRQLAQAAVGNSLYATKVVAS